MRSFVLITVFIAISCILGGCQRRTPEERLQKTIELMQSRDTLGATLEARELIKKHPDTPEATRAHLLLTQVYMAEQRPDDALQELENVLDKSSQKEEEGREALRMYLTILQQQKRHKDALATIDKYQKEYAQDDGTSLSLTVARADIMSQSGDTTQSRSILSSLVAETTQPEILRLYRDMIGRTYLVEGNTTAAIEYYNAEIANATDERTKRELAVTIAAIYSQAGDYEQARQYLQRATELFDAAIADEIDQNMKAQLALQLANAYTSTGNLPGAEQIYDKLFDARVNPQLLSEVVNGMIPTLLRQGKTSKTIELLNETGRRFPESNMAANAAQLESLSRQGMVESVAPVDTSTLVMRFREDDVLTLKNLALADAGTTETESSDAATTGAKSADAATTESAAAQPDPTAPHAETQNPAATPPAGTEAAPTTAPATATEETTIPQ